MKTKHARWSVVFLVSVFSIAQFYGETSVLAAVSNRYDKLQKTGHHALQKIKVSSVNSLTTDKEQADPPDQAFSTTVLWQHYFL